MLKNLFITSYEMDYIMYPISQADVYWTRE